MIDDSIAVVTGGASFIGSHLVDALVSRGCEVQVVDDLSSGRIEYIRQHIESGKVKLTKLDLEHTGKPELVKLFKDAEVIFHLAAVHGGRGYIDTHPADVMSNVAIDHHVFEGALEADASKVIFASSACAYPPGLQSEYHSDYRLKESDSDLSELDKPLSADLEYGWAKLMGEMQLRSFYKQYGLNGVSLRFVTVYGPRENESHAIIALINKAYERMDPYEIWGSGEQDRDFTYVSDIVNGCILAAEQIEGCDTLNLGTGARVTVKDVANQIFEIMKWKPRTIEFDTSKPEGVLSRCLDISKAQSKLGWHPKVSLAEGLAYTSDWYIRTKKREGRLDSNRLFQRG